MVTKSSRSCVVLPFLCSVALPLLIQATFFFVHILLFPLVLIYLLSTLQLFSPGPPLSLFYDSLLMYSHIWSQSICQLPLKLHHQAPNSFLHSRQIIAIQFLDAPQAFQRLDDHNKFVILHSISYTTMLLLFLNTPISLMMSPSTYIPQKSHDVLSGSLLLVTTLDLSSIPVNSHSKIFQVIK